MIRRGHDHTAAKNLKTNAYAGRMDKPSINIPVGFFLIEHEIQELQNELNAFNETNRRFGE